MLPLLNDALDIGAAARVWFMVMAVYLLKHVARLDEGEKLLVQSGASYLGQAVLQLAAQTKGVDVLTIVNTADEKGMLVEKIGLARASIIVTGNGKQAPHSGFLAFYLSHITQGGGMDVVIDFAPGFYMALRLTQCLFEFACVVFVLSGDEFQAQLPTIRGNICFSTVDPTRIFQDNFRLVAKLLAETQNFIENGVGFLQIYPVTKFAAKDLYTAVEWLQALGQNGIAFIKLRRTSERCFIQVIPAAPSLLRLNLKATYVLAGGLGFFGCRIADFMVRHGARHLMFLSRFGNNRYLERLQSLNKQGCAIVVLQCDVTFSADV